MDQKRPPGDTGEENKDGAGWGGDESKTRGEAKYGGDSEAAAAAKNSARARAATLSDSSACEAEVRRKVKGLLLQSSKFVAGHENNGVLRLLSK